MEYVGEAAFFVFLILSLIVISERKKIGQKPILDWVVDVVSLLMHFSVLPALQVIIVFGLLKWSLPELENTIESGVFASVLVYLIIDYLWYWNHRIMHSRTWLWNLHRTHHAPEQVDIFTTARNLIITHFLMVYFWAIGAAVYFFNDPTYFLILAAFGMILNFWGHTSFSLPCSNPFNILFTSVFVTPREHLWHHSQKKPYCNFGTVISLWDRLHGTFYCESNHPETYGDISYKKSIWNQLFWPF